MPYRIEKVEKMIKQEISLIFLHKLQDSSFGFVTITNVKVTPDFRLAKIYLSVFEKENREFIMTKVEQVAHIIRSELASRISLRFVPELKFYIDDTSDYVERIEELIKQIHQNDNPSE